MPELRWWRRRLRLSLALQGGGAHGAFSAGVLAALARQPALAFDGLSGSSAGALNAVLFAEGWRRGGGDGARQALQDFWQALGRLLPPGLVHDGEPPSASPAARWLFAWTQSLAPAQFNPLELNPLRELLLAQIDFTALRAAAPLRLYIAATAARSGRLRLFREQELSVETLLASTCLPRLHHPVLIDGEPYWDGGYAANPALFPLIAEGRADDLLLILLDPLQRDAVEQRVAAIDARIAELGFSAHLQRELQWLAQARALAASGLLHGPLERRLLRCRLHLIEGGELAELRDGRSKALAHGPFLERLFALGERQGQDWWAAQDGRPGAGVALRRFA